MEIVSLRESLSVYCILLWGEGMNNLSLPFNQDPTTLRSFSFWYWVFYVNRAKLNGRTWITRGEMTTNRYVHGWGISTQSQDGRPGLVHRATASVREYFGVKYLQLIFFSWWIAVLKKDGAQFEVHST